MPQPSKRFQILILALTAAVCFAVCLIALLKLITPKVTLIEAQVSTVQADSPEEKLSAVLGAVPSNDIDVSGKINLNTADAELLMTLPGIGETLAQRIIEYRTYNGAFDSIEDLMNVTGFGSGILEKIRDLITI